MTLIEWKCLLQMLFLITLHSRILISLCNQKATPLSVKQQYSTDGEPNNERAISQGRRRVANNTQPKGATASSSSGREARSNRNNNTETGVGYLAKHILVCHAL